jgi:hypothetical protein
MKDFFKWFFEKQFTPEQSHVWKEIITNFVTITLVIAFIYLLIKGQTIQDEMKMLLSMVLGYYFNSNNKKDKN